MQRNAATRLLGASPGLFRWATCRYHPPVGAITIPKGALVVDMRSDTVTRPSVGMKKAMMEAILGDDVYREDPTIAEFEQKVAAYTGKEAALFVPSGTMGNLISILVHCGQRGSEVLLGDQAHIFLYEQAGIAQMGGVQAHIVANRPDGTFDIDEVISKIRYEDIHCPVTELICVENTHNVCGGKVVPVEWIDELGRVAKEFELPLHMDGARVLNAAVSCGHTAERILQSCDTASICLSKGLGTPIGSVIVGSDEFIRQAMRTRKALGGGMRQAGILAAAGIYALENMVSRLADDHAHAQMLATSILDVGSKNVWACPKDVHTNIVLVELKPSVISPDVFCRRLSLVSDEERRVVGEDVVIKVMPWSAQSVRFVTHYDVTREHVEAAIAKIKFVISEIEDS
ncbi:uncharacterized protein LOC143029137 [Oratosquilla oratoria]|uniref:uncharacterized protein LOC143029137 n=1 Tax=Oratosquilla oratoria TaxID=337810 RepID=UPI003F7625F0